MVKVLHLYYDLMNLYGEYGNITVLNKHLLDQDLKVKVDKKTIGDSFDFDDYDFIYCGSGLESNLKIALADLKVRKEAFVKALENDKFILFTGNAMELLAKSIDDEEGLNLVDMSVKTSDKRYSGDVICMSENFGEVVGFINKSTIIKDNLKKHLFSYTFKDDNLSLEGFEEGYRIRNLIGTHIIGPILTKNPKLMKYLVRELGSNDKKTFQYKDIEYPYELESYNVTLHALKQRKK